MELSQSANVVSLPQSRLPEIDMLRGFALLGIAVENIFAIHTPNTAFAEYAAQYPNGFNHYLIGGLMLLVRGKFYPLFSFVFGLAAAYSLPKYGTVHFVRRLGGLFLLGLLQVMFIWNGDVLVQYALMGALLLLLRPLPPWSLFLFSTALLLVSFMGEGYFFSGTEHSATRAAVYATGSFWEVMQVRVQEYGQSIFTWSAVLFYARIFAFMLLGYAVVKAELLQKLISAGAALKAAGLHAMAVAGIAVFIWWMGWRGDENGSVVTLIKKPLLAVYFYSFVACYALVPVLFRQVLYSLKWLGQLTLTHYIFQNLLFSLLMYGYGLGLYGQLAPWQLLVMYVVVVAGQWAMSGWWIRRFGLGPAEVLLRTVAGNK